MKAEEIINRQERIITVLQKAKEDNKRVNIILGNSNMIFEANFLKVERLMWFMDLYDENAKVHLQIAFDDIIEIEEIRGGNKLYERDE